MNELESFKTFLKKLLKESLKKLLNDPEEHFLKKSLEKLLLKTLKGLRKALDEFSKENLKEQMLILMNFQYIL